MVDDIDLPVGKQHQIKRCCALEVSFNLVSNVVFLLIWLHHLRDDEGRVIELHQFGDVDNLIISELEDKVFR
jgi:hypothetical protein